jgi:hypothetical protein
MSIQPIVAVAERNRRPHTNGERAPVKKEFIARVKPKAKALGSRFVEESQRQLTSAA